MDQMDRTVHLAGTDLLLAGTPPSPSPSPAVVQLAYAGMSSHLVAAPVAPEKTGLLALKCVPEARSPNVVDGRMAADTETEGQKLAGSASARPGEFHDDIRSDLMVCALASVRTYVLSVPERKDLASGQVLPASEASVLDVSRKAPGGENQHEVALAARSDAPAGEDVIEAEEDQEAEDDQVAEQETGMDFSLDPSAEPWASSSSDTDDDDDLYNQGIAAAMEMDEETLRSEVAKYFRREANRERPQRRARNAAAANPAPAVEFSLCLSYQEAMEDVAAVRPALAQDVGLEAEVPALPRNAKRRRGG
jgi:hypothetical protein